MFLCKSSCTQSSIKDIKWKSLDLICGHINQQMPIFSKKEQGGNREACACNWSCFPSLAGLVVYKVKITLYQAQLVILINILNLVKKRGLVEVCVAVTNDVGSCRTWMLGLWQMGVCVTCSDILLQLSWGLSLCHMTSRQDFSFWIGSFL